MNKQICSALRKARKASVLCKKSVGLAKSVSCVIEKRVNLEMKEKDSYHPVLAFTQTQASFLASLESG